MKREEAIRKLQKQKLEYLEEWVDFSGVAEAYDMAIKALNQTKQIGCTGCEHYDQQQIRLICHECKRYYKDMYEDGEA